MTALKLIKKEASEGAKLTHLVYKYRTQIKTLEEKRNNLFRKSMNKNEDWKTINDAVSKIDIKLSELRQTFNYFNNLYRNSLAVNK